MNRWTLFSLLALITFLIGCSTVGNSDSDRRVYETQTRERVSEIQRRLHRLEQKYDKLDAKAQQKFAETRNDMREQLRKAEKQLSEMQSSSEKNWQEFKSKMSALLDDIEAKYKEEFGQ